MDHQLPAMSNADIDNLAEYFAQQLCPLPTAPGNPTPPALVGRCVACHGEDGRSRIATVPHLAGQQQYLENQLRAFRDSGVTDRAEPRTRVDPIMGYQTTYLYDVDIVAIAGYFAGHRCH